MVVDLFSKAKELISGRAAAPPAKPAKKAGASYHSVTIAPGPKCCALARGLMDTRYLSSKAPQLPLQGCDRTDCTCRYVHYADRRAGPRRARDMGVSIDGSFEREKEHRQTKSRGRREDDE